MCVTVALTSISGEMYKKSERNRELTLRVWHYQLKLSFLRIHGTCDRMQFCMSKYKKSKQLSTRKFETNIAMKQLLSLRNKIFNSPRYETKILSYALRFSMYANWI